MRILAFETSAKAASVALLNDGVLLAEYYQNSGQTHSRTVMKMAEDLLCNCDLTVEQVDAVAVAAGPGSFTGVRIGVAAAKGFAWGRQLPCCGVSTLEAMAWSSGLADGVVVPAMDARRSQVYTAIFRMEQGVPQRLMEDSTISMEELCKKLQAVEGRKILVGDGAQLCYNTIGKQLPDLCLMPEHLRHQRASGVALAAQRRLEQGIACDGASMTPSYLRLSQAERERLERLQSTRGDQ